MCQIITSIAIVLLAGLSLVSAKCDMMKEFKPDVDMMMQWAQSKCGAKGSKTDISQADMNKAKNCYVQNVQPKLKSACAKKVDTFVNTKIFNNPNINKCCYDDSVQKGIKSAAIKDIGMQGGMCLKKECEADCPGWKTTLDNFNKCCKS